MGVCCPCEGWPTTQKRMAYHPGGCGIPHSGGWCTAPGKADSPPQRGWHANPGGVVYHPWGALPLGKLIRHPNEDGIPSCGAWHITQGGVSPLGKLTHHPNEDGTPHRGMWYTTQGGGALPLARLLHHPNEDGTPPRERGIPHRVGVGWCNTPGATDPPPRRGWHTIPGVWYTTQGGWGLILGNADSPFPKRMVYHPGACCIPHKGGGALHLGSLIHQPQKGWHTIPGGVV